MVRATTRERVRRHARPQRVKPAGRNYELGSVLGRLNKPVDLGKALRDMRRRFARPHIERPANERDAPQPDQLVAKLNPRGINPS